MANPVGRPPKFETAEDLQKLFDEYKRRLPKDEIPDVEGFCNFIDSYRDLFSEYEKKEEFSDTIKRIKNWIYYKKKQMAMVGKMPAPIFIFDAKNNFGYKDKTESEITNPDGSLNPYNSLTAEQLRKLADGKDT